MAIVGIAGRPGMMIRRHVAAKANDDAAVRSILAPIEAR
jgi:hypothetical protein